MDRFDHLNKFQDVMEKGGYGEQQAAGQDSFMSS